MLKKLLIWVMLLSVLPMHQAVANEPPYAGRSLFSMDRKIKAALEDINSCASGTTRPDYLFCSVYYSILASGYYHKGQFDLAATYARKLKTSYAKLSPGSACPWIDQKFDNDEISFHKTIDFAYHQMAFEVFAKADAAAARKVAMRAFICEAFKTDGYKGGWTNLGSRRLDQK